MARVSQDGLHRTPTTGGAPRVLSPMKDCPQTERPDRPVFPAATGERRAGIPPHSTGIVAAPRAFPRLAMPEGREPFVGHGTWNARKPGSRALHRHGPGGGRARSRAAPSRWRGAGSARRTVVAPVFLDPTGERIHA